MNRMRNQVQLIGRLGAKAEINHFESGRVKASFKLATKEIYKNTKGEKVEETTWHSLVAWGSAAEIIEKYTDKGSEIMISGKLANRSYNDKDGNKKYITEVQVDDVLLLGDKVSTP
ncbi:Single-stranded DNA-binding protein [Mariniradius saccharolyticus AK6]|uniref:Single-stranded DNA-binding protein n=1 Tax=Mariniradius saccharolyticus AK6 TaxID=1239962 RepID=M7XFK2_9BACT|nr:single-stranded DNA-binding protein [Mariniradius saccharolyticus]EMS33644.1 Single-stranded DNA-binding protein [Mariniradius saccharolyticus AK6]